MDKFKSQQEWAEEVKEARKIALHFKEKVLAYSAAFLHFKICHDEDCTDEHICSCGLSAIQNASEQLLLLEDEVVKLKMTMHVDTLRPQ